VDLEKEKGTMDPIACLEAELRKAQVNKEVVVALFCYVEKAYDLLWKGGLLIQMKRLGISGKMFRWVKLFFVGALNRSESRKSSVGHPFGG